MRRTRTCGCRRAGIVLNASTGEVQRCDECRLFETDADAAKAVDHLLLFLGKVYDRRRDTVADAFDALADMLTS